MLYEETEITDLSLAKDTHHSNTSRSLYSQQLT